MSWIDELFGGGRAAAAGAMSNELNQGLGSMSGLFNQGFGYLNPFMSREAGQYQQYLSALNQGQNPMQLYNQFASQYKMSPEAQAQIQLGQKAANNASAASGMLGSGASQTAAANLAQSIRSQDFDKYMGNIFGLRNQYLGGLSGLQREGYGAAMQGSDLAAREAQMQQKYYEDLAGANAEQQEAQSGGLSNLFGQGLGVLGGLFGGQLSHLFWGGGAPTGFNGTVPDLPQPF